MLTKNEFKILYEIYNNGYINQRTISSILDISLGLVNKVIQDLMFNNYLDQDRRITDSGKEVLNNYKVDNAIIMAAGMSSRFAPLSYEKPKGLLVVKDEVLIERQIRQLQAKGITDITVVLGYMKEQFFYLGEKFNVDIVINEDYYRYNNTSSLMLVLDKLKNTYICSSDNYFITNVFNTHEYESYYPVRKEKAKAGEYFVSFDKQGRIFNVNFNSGQYYMIGQVFFDKEFSEKFKNILAQEFVHPETKTSLWEKIYIKHIKEFNMYAKVDTALDIHEFDSLAELREFDPHYINNTDSNILRNIACYLDCAIADIVNIEAIKEGLTNTSFKFSVDGNDYVYRHPGIGTQEYINRKAEAEAIKIAFENGLDDSYIHINEEEGWKISHYLKNCRTLDYHNDKEVKLALELVKKFHELEINSTYEFNIWNKTNEFISKIERIGRNNYSDFETLYEKMKKVFECVEKDNYPKFLCHCDFYDPNILFVEDKPYLIDWEYAGVDDPGTDIGTFIACSDYTVEEANRILDIYERKTMSPERRRHFLGYTALASYYWFVWAIFQETNGASVGEYLYIWYKNSHVYGDIALGMYGE